MFAMCLSLNVNSPFTTGKTIFFKTAIFIAVLIACISTNAQEYNNWLLRGGTILNFDTSPATIICGENEDVFARSTVMLSDDNGQAILCGYKVTPPPNASSSISDFVIKNKHNQTIVSYSCADLRNVMGCKLPQGGYYIVAVLRLRFEGELHIYKFNKIGALEDEFVYKDGDYTFFTDLIPSGKDVVLVAYKYNNIETYKLTSDGCSLWTNSDIALTAVSNLEVPFFDIEHTIDGSTIIATAYHHAYIFDFDKNNGIISIKYEFEGDKFWAMSFSKTDKYFLIVDDNKLKGFLYSANFDFNLDNPDIVYDLPYEGEYNLNQFWNVEEGPDGKLYVKHSISGYITVLDGIEEGNITEENIQSERFQAIVFPHIQRVSCNAFFDNAYVCHGQPLNVILTGDAPFELSYTIDGIPQNIITSNKKYQIPYVAGKYKITKIKDASCEIVPIGNNEAEIAPEMKKVKIIAE